VRESQSAFARRKSVSLVTVGKWKKHGLLCMVGNLVDVEPSLLKLEQRPTNERRDQRREPSREDDSSSDAKSPPNNGRSSELNATLLRKEAATAKLKELEYDRLSSKVVDATQAAKVVGGILSTVRNRMLGIPSKVVPFLTLAQDAETVRTILDQEIALALGDVVRECSAESLRARFQL
jgi:hypothetical protein